MKWNNSSIFIALSATYIVLSYISSVVLNLNGVMAHSLSEQLTAEQINEVLSFKDKWQWVGYVFVPILLLIKISVTALLIDIGCLFYNEKLPYKQLFRMVLLGECIFLAVPIIKLCWFAACVKLCVSFSPILLWRMCSISIRFQHWISQGIKALLFGLSILCKCWIYSK